MDKKKNKISRWEKYEFFIIAFLMMFFIFTSYFIPGVMPYHGDESRHDVPPSILIHKSLIEDGEFQLWIHNLNGGWPAGNIANMMTSPVLIALNYIVDSLSAVSLSRIAYMAIFFTGFFLLSRLFLKDLSAVVVSLAVLLTSNTLYSTFGHTWMLFGFAFTPLNIYLLFKSVSSKKYVFYSVLLGLSFAAQFLGGVVHLYYQIFFFMLFGLLYIFTKIIDLRKFPVLKFSPKNLVKMLKIVIIVAFVFFGLSSFRLLFFLDFVNYTDRSSGLPFDQVLYSDDRPSFENINEFFILSGSKNSSFNIVGHILFVFALYYAYRKKSIKIWFLGIVYIAYVLVAGGFMARFFYDNLPFFKSQKAIIRIFSTGLIFGAIAAGYGFKGLCDLVSKKISSHRNLLKLSMKYAILILAIGMFIFLKGGISLRHGGINHDLVRNFDLPSVLDDESIYRIHMIEIRGVDYHEITPPLIYHDLESPYGALAAVWDSRYFHNFLGVILSRPELMGMFNIKYILSSQELNLSYVEYVGNFTNGGKDGLRVTPDYGEEGMVYRHKFSMPRAVYYKNPVLIIGNYDNVLQFGYYSMMQSYFDFNKTAIVFAADKSISDFTLQELSTFYGIVLLPGSLDAQSDISLLGMYSDKGGRVLPDITSGEGSLDVALVEDMFNEINSLNESRYEKVEITKYYDSDPNTLEVSLQDKKGLLFLSEKYTLYEGWTGIDQDGGKIDYYAANGVLTGVILDGSEESIRFDFMPKSWKRGMVVAKIVFVLIIIYFIGLILYKKTDIIKNKFLRRIYESS
ncbi:MAG: hypothetical protein ACLFUO_06765 [Candidatus Woesearchaeota archaeon]